MFYRFSLPYELSALDTYGGFWVSVREATGVEVSEGSADIITREDLEDCRDRSEVERLVVFPDDNDGGVCGALSHERGKLN